jgi:hypothetical protein
VVATGPYNLIWGHTDVRRTLEKRLKQTRWTALLRRPRGWPKNERVPTAGECYRFGDAVHAQRRWFM